MALLAAYTLWKEAGETLEDYLDNKVFADAKASTLMADEETIAGFNAWVDQYEKTLAAERAAVQTM